MAINANAGTMNVNMLLNNSSFNQAVNNTAKQSKQTMTSAFSGIQKVIALAFSVKKVIDFGKACIDVASNLQEVQNVVNTAMPTMTRQFDEFAKSAAKNFGLSELQAKKMGGTFASMASSFGFTEQQAYDMATTLTGLAGDVGSFYNLNAEEAETKLKSVFTGETETLKELGVVMTQTALDAYALENGYNKTTAKMSEQEKVALRYSFVLDKLKLAQGDFQKTQDSWANQTRILSLNLQSLKANLGAVFIQALSPCLQMLNSFLEKLVEVSAKVKDFFGIETDYGLETAGETAQSAVEGIGDATSNATKEIEGGLSSLDDVTILDSGSDDSSSSGDGSVNVQPLEYDTSKAEQGTSKLSKILDGIKKKAQEVGKIFSRGFNLTFDDNGVELEEHLKSIKNSIGNIFDEEVQNRANQSLVKMIENWGKIAGSVSSIGATIAEYFLGMFSTYLSDNGGTIKEIIIGFFDLSDKYSDLQAKFAETINNITMFLRGENAQQVGADILAMFTIPFAQLVELAGNIGLDILNTLLSPFSTNAELISETFDNLLGGISPVITAIKDFIIGAIMTVKETYDTYVKPFIDTIAEVLTNILKTILEGWNTYMQPVVDKLSALASDVIANKVKPAWDSMCDAIGEVFNVGSAILKNWIEPIITKLIDFLYPIIAKLADILGGAFLVAWGLVSDALKVFWDIIGGIIGTIADLINGDMPALKETFSNVAESIKNVWGGFKDFFKGVWDGIKGVFGNVADWFKDVFSNAWKKVKSVFTDTISGFGNIASSVGSTLKTVFNKIMGGIESVINTPFEKLNDLVLDLKYSSFLGISPFRWMPYPLVPHLYLPRMYAKGWGMFKPNNPQLVGVGDNKHQNEYILLQSQLKSIMNEVVRENNRYKGANTNGLVNNVGVYIGNEKIYGKNEEYLRIQGKRAGRTVFA